MYHATKYAVEAISDAMRYEVAPWGIDVVLVKPAAVDTPLVGGTLENAFGTQPGSPYREHMAAMIAAARKSLADPSALISAEDVAKTVYEAATAKDPSARYRVGAVARILPMLHNWLPTSAWDGMWRSMFKPEAKAEEK